MGNRLTLQPKAEVIIIFAMRETSDDYFTQNCITDVFSAFSVLYVQDSGIDIGDISERKALRKKLQCKTFRWYLVSVYPEMRMYSDTVAYGVVRILFTFLILKRWGRKV